MGKLSGLLWTSVRLYLLHIHFIMMTTNRKELNGEWSKSIQIDLAGPCWVSQGRGGLNQMKGRKGWKPSLYLISLHSIQNYLNAILLPRSVSHFHNFTTVCFRCQWFLRSTERPLSVGCALPNPLTLTYIRVALPETFKVSIEISHYQRGI